MARNYPTWEIKRGEDIARTWNLKEAADGSPLDLSGYTVRCEARTEEDVLVDTATCTVTDASAGQVVVSFTREQTQDWPLTSGTNYVVGDLELVSATKGTRHSRTFEILVRKEITQDVA